MAIDGTLPAYLAKRAWYQDDSVSRDIQVGAQLASAVSQRQQQERVLRLREEHFRLQREELERIAQGTVETSSVFAEMGQAGDYTNPALRAKFWDTVKRNPKFTQSPAFKDMVDTLQAADSAQVQLERLNTTYDLRAGEVEQRHLNRLDELDQQYGNMLSRQSLAQEDRIEIEKLRQKLQVERDALKPTTQRPERFDLDEKDRMEYSTRLRALESWLDAQPPNKKDPDAPYKEFQRRLDDLSKEFEPRRKTRKVGQPMGEVSTQSDFKGMYDALPSGAEYIAPDGKKRIKR